MMKFISKYVAKVFYLVLNLGIAFRVKLRAKEAYQKVNYSNTFKNYFVYWLLVFDKERNRYFDKAFQKITNYDEVLEVGTGFSAFLSLKILKRNSKRLISYEENLDSYMKAKEILSSYNNVSLINDSPHNHTPPHSFNVVVQEIIGSIASAEGAGFAMKSLIPFHSSNTRYIPKAAKTMFLPVEQRALTMFEKVIDYFLVEKSKIKSFYRYYNFPLKKELSKPKIFEDLQFDQDNCKRYQEEHCFTINNDGLFSGLLFYVEVYFDQENVLNTLRDKTNWSTPFLRLFNHDIVVEKGDTLNVMTEIDLSVKEPSYKVNLTLNAKNKIFKSEYQWDVVSRWQTQDLNNKTSKSATGQ